tara:strand:+ start:75 stop:623 length:549 start_codon:yes stop_codon:yes gene_type:complete
MKKLVVLFILIFATNLNAQFFSKKSQFEIFDMHLYDSAEQHASTSEMRNKFDHVEAKNFSDILIENKSSNSFDEVYISVDKSNTIHEIYAVSLLNASYSDCYEGIALRIVQNFVNKYYVEFENYEDAYKDFSVYAYSTQDRRLNSFRIQCNYEYSTGQVALQMLYQTPEISRAIDEFYNDGF